MDKRQINGEKTEISLLGFGCMRFPTTADDSQGIDEAQATEMIDYALANGINYFDTAYMYHEGTSEKFVGKALCSRHPRESFYLASKMPPGSIKTPADVHRIFDEQLANCQVDYFDFYLLHSVSAFSDPIFQEIGVYDILAQKKAEGKIRRLGFSFHDGTDLLEEVVSRHDWDFGQIQLNYLDWEMQNAQKIYQILTDKKIPVIVMEPVRGGALVSLCEESVAIFQRANQTASTASWAIRFAASLPNVLTVLSGMSTMDQLADNIKTLSPLHPLSNGEKETIEAALAAYRRTGTIPCTACRYCMDCPAGVDIPKVFALYNQFCVGQNEWSFQNGYRGMGEHKQAHQCVGCGKCTGPCPQAIAIPEWMAKIDASVKAMNNRK